jgi:GNAT superfamily N-acetyltransferase
MIVIAQESPLGADLGLLMTRHTADMHADTPPESIHMMDAGQLAAPGIRFFVMRDSGQPIGMGAFKRIDPQHAEIKSMHVLAEMRGRGLSRKMLDHLMTEAAADGFTLCRGTCALCQSRLCPLPAIRRLLGRSKQRFPDTHPCVTRQPAAKEGHSGPVAQLDRARTF